MAKRKKSVEPVDLEEKSWIVYGTMEHSGEFIVNATTPEEAIEKINKGEYEDFQVQETPNWEATGEPEPNE